jgi:hypothetical protein
MGKMLKPIYTVIPAIAGHFQALPWPFLFLLNEVEPAFATSDWLQHALDEVALETLSAVNGQRDKNEFNVFCL